MSEKTVNLPRINSANHRQKMNNNQQQTIEAQIQLEGQPADNPFYIPEDYEIFKMKEKEKEIRKQDRQKNQNLKIWEKGIKSKGAFTVGRLNELCKIDEENDDDFSKLNIVDAAKSAIKNRVRQKEPMHQFLEKKREMLLFQMLIDHKREQINQFEELTRLHRRGLEKSEQMLEEDLNAFNNFLEENKNKSRQTIKDAEDETKRKQERINEIKQLQELKADLTTKNTQKIENLEEMQRYKKFLDSITPKEVIGRIQQEKESRKQQKKGQQKHNKKKNETDKFQMNISKDIQDILEDSDDELETYFNDPNQLEDFFQDLEQTNLFLIENTKETEQQVEEIKKEYEDKKKELNKVKQSCISQKQDLLKQLDQINEQTRHLKMVKGDNEAQKQLESLESEIYKVYKNDFLHDRQQEIRKDIQGIELLKEMENKLEEYIAEIKHYIQKDPNLVTHKERDYYTKKRQNRTNDPARQEQEQQILLYKQKEFNKEKKEKRYGRPIMAKSILMKQEKKEKEEVIISEDSLDNSRYFS